MNRNIVLIGFMGSGKTTVGRILSKKLKKRFIDTDKYIQRKHNTKISYIFNKYGEDYFRKLEHEAIKEIHMKKNSIISTGGGVVLNRDNVDLLKKEGVIFLLESSPETVINNLMLSKNKRPLLSKENWEDEVRLLLNNRKKIYHDSADHIINVDNIGLKSIVNEVVKVCKKFDIL